MEHLVRLVQKELKHACVFRLVGSLNTRAISKKHLVKAELSHG